MSEPMTDERLSEIRARVKNAWAIQAVGPANMGDLEPWQLQSIAVAYVDDVADLLDEVDRLRAEVDEGNAALHEQIQAWMGQKAEVDRLRARELGLAAENAAMRPIVEAVANLADNSYGVCVVCGFDSDDHGPGCPAEQARAVVAAHPATDTAESEGE